MKIVCLGPVPPQRGGISHYNASLIQKLRSNGHEVLPISFERMYPPFLFPGTSEVDPASKPLDGAERILLPWHPGTWATARARIRAFDPERVVVHHWHPFFVLGLRSVIQGLPASAVDVIAHNVLPHEHGFVGRLLNPLLFKRATRVYVGARSEEKKLQILAPGVEAVFMPHPVYDRFSESPSYQKQAEAKKALGYRPDETLFFHLGLVRHYKGVDILLDALAHVKQPGIHLEVAGEFYEDAGGYASQLARLGLQDRVRLVNQYLSDDELALRLQAADGVILPYRHATQSGIAMAALAAGVPVIASRVGSLADVVAEGESGCLAQPGDPHDLTRAIVRFLQIGVDRWRMSRSQIAQSVRERYTWDALATKVAREA
ncbi:glycosyltransferase [bacterium]|nr:glycosyltransferase [bacterium]